MASQSGMSVMVWSSNGFSLVTRAGYIQCRAHPGQACLRAKLNWSTNGPDNVFTVFGSAQDSHCQFLIGYPPTIFASLVLAPAVPYVRQKWLFPSRFWILFMSRRNLCLSANFWPLVPLTTIPFRFLNPATAPGPYRPWVLAPSVTILANQTPFSPAGPITHALASRLPPMPCFLGGLSFAHFLIISDSARVLPETSRGARTFLRISISASSVPMPQNASALRISI